MPIGVGTLLGPYQITARIGAGGMGEVFRARDNRLKRDVAIKTLPANFALDQERAARFQQEAEVLASLNHPNIAGIYELIEVEGLKYLVLEFVDGETLAGRLERGSLPLDEALQVSKQIAAALEAAHELGVVHRDLKPENIKITPNGTVKLLDFGIAKREAVDVDRTALGLTAAGAIVGTVGYMAPEQIRGERVTSASDQFALGVILFQMLTGKAPFGGNSTAETLAAILRDKPPVLGQLNPDIPSPVQWIMDRCLAKQSCDRYTSTRDLAKDLATLGDRLARSQAGTALLAPSNLPAPRISLVGRDEELAGGRALLLRDDVRLVTFTGPGGTGKTRLALQVAANVNSAFPGGVFFVALASISDPSLVASTVVQILGARELGSRRPAEVLTEALRSVQEDVLLVLDNFEQVLDAAPLLTDLLENCSRLKVLVTSRAVLRVYGEYEFQVPPLKLPARDAAISANTLAGCPSVALFMQRATAVKPDFTLTDENASAIAEICARLDGLPLAIELAAARVRTLTPKAMLQRLSRRLDLLTGGARNLPERQQTLRAAVEWSYGLLDEDEQKLFRRLAVFVNGCTLEAVEAVCNAAEDFNQNVLDVIESLAGKSLIQQTESSDGEARFTMLETIRDYAAERLAASPDEPLMRRAHAAYCLVLAEESGEPFSPAERSKWLARCQVENNNLRAALEWIFRTKQGEWGLRMAASLFPFWLAHEMYGEGRQHLDAVLTLPGGDKVPKARGRVLQAAGNLAWQQGDYVASRHIHQEQLALFRSIQDVAGIASALNSLGVAEHAVKNIKAAREIFEEQVALSRQSGNRAGVAGSLNNLAFLYQSEGDLEGAKSLCEEALEIYKQLNDLDGTAWLHSRLGDLERKLGDLQAARRSYDRARSIFEKIDGRTGLSRTLIDIASLIFEQGQHEEAYRILTRGLNSYRELGNRQGIARALEEFANFAAALGESNRALRLAGAAGAIRHSIGAAASQDPLEERNKQLDAARLALGHSALDVEMYGWSMSIDAAVEYALSQKTD